MYYVLCVLYVYAYVFVLYVHVHVYVVLLFCYTQILYSSTHLHRSDSWHLQHVINLQRDTYRVSIVTSWCMMIPIPSRSTRRVVPQMAWVDCSGATKSRASGPVGWYPHESLSKGWTLGLKAVLNPSKPNNQPHLSMVNIVNIHSFLVQLGVLIEWKFVLSLKRVDFGISLGILGRSRRSCGWSPPLSMWSIRTK